MTTAAIIVAAGRGTRAGGDLPKQWQTLAGRTVAAHAMQLPEPRRVAAAEGARVGAVADERENDLARRDPASRNLRQHGLHEQAKKIKLT